MFTELLFTDLHQHWNWEGYSVRFRGGGLSRYSEKGFYSCRMFRFFGTFSKHWKMDGQPPGADCANVIGKVRERHFIHLCAAHRRHRSCGARPVLAVVMQVFTIFLTHRTARHPHLRDHYSALPPVIINIAIQ